MTANLITAKLLDEASALLDDGRALAAAMVARTALERTLRELADRNGCGDQPRRPSWNRFARTPAKLLAFLSTVWALTHEDDQGWRAAWRLFDDASHGVAPDVGELRDALERTWRLAGGRSGRNAELEIEVDDVQVGYLPSEVEITTACVEIRAGWSRREERSRRSWSVPPPVEFPAVEEVYLLQVAEEG